MCTCPDSFTAANVVEILESNGIALRQHDETADQRPGSHGPNPGIAIYVFDSDLEKARELVDPIINGKYEDVRPFCPKCGSEETVYVGRYRYASLLIILSTLFILLPCVYFIMSDKWGIRLAALDYVFAAMLVSSIVMMIVSKSKNVNRQCKICGKRFNHI